MIITAFIGRLESNADWRVVVAVAVLVPLTVGLIEVFVLTLPHSPLAPAAKRAGLSLSAWVRTRLLSACALEAASKTQATRGRHD